MAMDENFGHWEQKGDVSGTVARSKSSFVCKNRESLPIFDSFFVIQFKFSRLHVIIAEFFFSRCPRVRTTQTPAF